MLITHYTGDCPKCGVSNRYGNIFIRNNSILRGCQKCKYKERITLPNIQKKVIYLDQAFFSGAFRQRDSRFNDIVNKIKLLSHKQLLVAPFSTVHEDETHLWAGYDDKTKEDLLDFIKTTSRGHSFEADYDVERRQVIKAYMSFLDDEPDEFMVDQSIALTKHVHKWDDYFRVDINRYLGDSEGIRKGKEDALNKLLEVFEAWRNSKGTFENDLKNEIEASWKGYIQTYQQYFKMMLSMNGGGFLDAPIKSMVLQEMLRYTMDRFPMDLWFQKPVEFFQSTYYSNLPYIQISCRVQAALAELVRGGAFSNTEKNRTRFRGFFHDVKHISIYAPYCDIIVVDRAMASLMKNQRLNIPQRYDTHVYDIGTLPALIAHLDEIERNITNEHRSALELAYPSHG